MLENKAKPHNWINKTGEISETRFGTKMIIIKYESQRETTIEFCDEHKVTKCINYINFKQGVVKNPYDKSIYGIGYIGEGYLTKENGVSKKEYTVWKDIIRRCYSKENKATFVAYNDCVVCEEWKNYSVFAKWYNDNKYMCSDLLEVDKDILSCGSKIYSPQTCILIPRKINRFCQSSKIKGSRIVKSGKWKSSLHHNKKTEHCRTVETKEMAEKNFIDYKNKVFQDMVEDFKKEFPQDVYDKLKNSRLVA